MTGTETAVDPHRGRTRWAVILAAAGGVVLLALVVLYWPHVVEGTGTLSECLSGYPVITVDGADPDQGQSIPAWPVHAWPPGLTYDAKSHAIMDSSNQPIVRIGDRVTLKGTIVDVHGDPSPCFRTKGVELSRIAPAP